MNIKYFEIVDFYAVAQVNWENWKSYSCTVEMKESICL